MVATSRESHPRHLSTVLSPRSHPMARGKHAAPEIGTCKAHRRRTLHFPGHPAPSSAQGGSRPHRRQSRRAVPVCAVRSPRTRGIQSPHVAGAPVLRLSRFVRNSDRRSLVEEFLHCTSNRIIKQEFMPHWSRANRSVPMRPCAKARKQAVIVLRCELEVPAVAPLAREAFRLLR